MQIKTLTGTVLLMLACGGYAGAEVFKWKDASGRWVFSDRPPVGAVAERMRVYTPALAPRDASAPLAAKPGVAGPKDDAATLNRKIEEENRRLRESNCKVARGNLALVEAGKPVDASQLATVQKTVQEWCGK